MTSDSSQLGDDATLSADLFLQKANTSGQWFIYIEGNSSLRADNISSQIVESNADAGTALDPDRKGRIQLSEFNYQFIRDDKKLTVGLLDPSAYLDRSRITNDENVQFLGAAFVNNTSIEFPDYTLGLVYQQAAKGSLPQINAVVTSAAGLADNPNLSYSQLFQVNDKEDGLFTGVGLGWETPSRLLRIGVWRNSQSHHDLLQRYDDKSNYGAYMVLGQSWQQHAVNLRIGTANSEVSENAGFLALAYRYRWANFAMGAGVAHTLLAADARAANRADSTQMELFGRYDYNNMLHLTASVQYIRHSNFTAVAEDPKNAVLLGGFRVHLAF